jgi:outer membrane protein TolC
MRSQRPAILFMAAALVAAFLIPLRAPAGEALVPPAPAAHEAPPLTPIGLEEAVALAIKHNPQVVAGQMSLEAAVDARKSVRAGFLPSLSTSATFMYYSEKPGFGSVDFGMEGLDPSMCASLMDEGDEQLFCSSLLGGFASMSDIGNSFQSEQYDFKISITLAQPLTPLYQIYYGYKLADLGVDVARIEMDKTVTELKMQTIEAYYGYLKARAALRSMDEAIVGVEAHVKKAEAFFEADFMTKNDLLQAEVQLAQLKGTRLEVEQGVAISREGLLVLLDEPVGSPLEPADQPDVEAGYLDTAHIPSELEALELARKNRPELKQMKKTLEQARAAVKLAAGGFIPQISAFGSYQHEEGSVMELPEFVVGAQLSWTIWDWGGTYYSVKEAKARSAAAEAGYDALERAMGLEVKQALLGIELAQKKIEIGEEAVVAAEEQLRIENERYDKQVSTTTDVLDATTRLVGMQVSLATSRYDHLLAVARLRKACGTL